MSVYASRSRLRRRTIICRGLALLLAASICYFLLVSPTQVQASPVERSSLKPQEDHAEEREARDVREVSAEATSPAAKRRTEPVQLTLEESKSETTSSLPATAAPTAEIKTAPVDKHTKDDDAAFAKALQHGINLLPTGLALKGLLSPIDEAGVQLLRALGDRVRVFAEAFAAWEAIHTTGSGDVLREDGIIKRIRGLPKTKTEVRNLVKGYDALRSYISSSEARLFPGTMAMYGNHMALHQSFAGRGIVLTAGNDHVPYLLTGITTFRKLGCDLPIEVMYLGDNDISADLRDELEKLPGVITRDLKKMVNDVGWELAGWAAKPWAILMSSFREALFIDADALFLTSPTTLFDSPQYAKTGALFFLDRNISPESKRGWLRTVIPPPYSAQVKSSRLWTGESGHQQESGVVLVDKRKHFVPLLLCARLNGQDRDSDSDKGKQGVYDMVYGDKETFWLSWELAGDVEYSFHQGGAGVMGRLNGTEEIDVEGKVKQVSLAEAAEAHKGKNITVCAPQLLHLDTDGRPLWFNGWISKDKNERSGNVDISAFQVFLEEPEYKAANGENNMWEIHEANVCCLTAPKFSTFTKEEKEVLQMILDTAKSVDWS
ncbi:hypothetical protein B0A51_14795 [Rachicladosporium sp. CCFEE 5018]|nr:hypothetical protein B0A51_14795 [Rachicladosporium sp. CCFEE 5018]OQO17125.1 hypothetical protein B0A51_14550 [Rachicladosporium sp. CCFEE 5018]OQO21355.1 hypothetical protein B0A51_10066 [Rachicladosporium sp. CCFEE 5018]OQO24568.1 hypothetical protein B0A51_07739 [Rachicladosporium sp. CCFEE 5018]